MNEENGIFVKTFRDEKAFENHKDELGEKKNQFDNLLNEEIVKGKLATATGLALQPCNDAINPDSVYPEMDLNDEWQKKAFDAMTSVGDDQNNALNYGGLQFVCWSRKLRASDLPTNVLEELVIANQYGFFESRACYHNWGTRHHSHEDFLFVGFRDGKAYPIVYWGREKTWERIEYKVKELEEKRENEKTEVATGMPTKNPSLRFKLVTFGCAILVCLVLAYLFTTIDHGLLWPFNEKTEAAQIENPVEEIQEFDDVEKKIWCACDKTKLYTSRSQMGGELNTSYPTLSGWLEVDDKNIKKCKVHNKNFYRLIINVGKRHWFIPSVSEEIFNQLKVGDKIPVNQKREF